MTDRGCREPPRLSFVYRKDFDKHHRFVMIIKVAWIDRVARNTVVSLR